jgi:hypothetical protein
MTAENTPENKTELSRIHADAASEALQGKGAWINIPDERVLSVKHARRMCGDELFGPLVPIR